MPVSWTSSPDDAGSNSSWRQNMGEAPRDWPQSVKDAHHALQNGESISLTLGVNLLNEPDFDSVAELASMIKSARFGDHVFFNSNVHINQTNICVLACKFCAFRRGRRSDEAYQMTIDEYISQIAVFAGDIDEVHSVGGLHPEWDINHYEELF